MNSRNPPQSMSNDSFADSAPSSDGDPYDGSTQYMSYNIDRSNFPKPMPIFGPLFGFNDKRFSMFLQARVATASQILDRPPTQEEVTALAYHTAKYMSVISWGGPLGIAGGLWRCYGTRDTFRFPFFQPNLEKLQVQAFPTPKMPVVRGLWAVTAWHLVRGSAYSIMGNIIAQIFFASYATSVTLVGELVDPRLKQFHEAIKKRGRESAEKRQGTLPGMGQPGQMQGPQPQTQQSEIQDDASPTGGMYGQADMTPTPGTYETAPQRAPPRRQFPQRRPVPAEAPVESSDSSPFDIIDDASPTGGQGMYGATAQPQPQSQGSAWERLRRGEKPAPVPSKTSNSGARTQQQIQTQREQREGATLGESYTFSKSDEERSYARDEAQKEFDARIERERRGGDFNSGSGNRKW